MQTTPYIHPSQDYMSLYPKSYAEIKRIFTQLGIKYLYLHVLGLCCSPGLDLKASFTVTLKKDHPR